MQILSNNIDRQRTPRSWSFASVKCRRQITSVSSLSIGFRKLAYKKLSSPKCFRIIVLLTSVIGFIEGKI